MSVKEAIAAANLPVIWILETADFKHLQRSPSLVWALKNPNMEEHESYKNYKQRYGELLRACVMSGSPKGIQLFGVMEKGHHVPDEEVVQLLAEAMNAKVATAKGFLIDGFPASLEQAVKFEEEIGSPSKVISLEANEEVLKGRLKERGNFDDSADSVLKRITLFTEKTRPVIEKYKKIVKQVNAEKKPNEVFDEVCKALE